MPLCAANYNAVKKWALDTLLRQLVPAVMQHGQRPFQRFTDFHRTVVNLSQEARRLVREAFNVNASQTISGARLAGPLHHYLLFCPLNMI